MTLKKRNKLIAAKKRAIKKRLMEISIYVDCYIYKNRPIHLDEAITLADEISHYRTQWINDTHILQVTEKLSRFMKRIIEESTNMSPTNEKLNKSDCESIGLFSESSVSNGHGNNIKTIQSCNLETNVETDSTNKQDRFNESEVIVISDDEKNESENKDVTKLPVFYKCINGLPANSSKLILIKKMNIFKLVNHEGAPVASDKEINNKRDITTQIIPINEENVQHINRKSLKSKLIKQNDFYAHKNALNNNNMVDHSHKLKLSLRNAGNEETQKDNSLEIIQTLLPTVRTNKLKKEKTINKSTSKKLKIPTNITKKRKPKTEKTERKIQNKRNKRIPKKNKENITSASCVVQPSSTNSKQTRLDVSNEISLPTMSTDNDTLITECTNPVLITKQMSVLKIHNECVANDLSWIENIKYVREINMDEFEQTPNKYHETFWNTFTLPNGWSDAEFID